MSLDALAPTAKALDPTILRAYDIRGVIGQTLSVEDSRAIGRAFGTAIAGRGGRQVCVGFDGRLSSPDLEAAVVDGATFGQRFRMVVLPLMLPIITIATILRVIYTIQNFVIVYMLTQGGPGYATETLALYVYETAFNSARLGKASAIGVTWFFYTLVFVVLYLKLIGREERRA